MDQSVQILFKVGLAPATLKAYCTGTNRYISFCVLYNIINPFPLTEDVLSHFVAFLYKEGLKAGTVESYVPGSNSIHSNFMRSGESPLRRHEQTGKRYMGVKKLTGAQLAPA